MGAQTELLLAIVEWINAIERYRAVCHDSFKDFYNRDEAREAINQERRLAARVKHLVGAVTAEVEN